MRVDSSVLLFVAASALATHIACGSSPATPGAPVAPPTLPTPPPTPTPDPGIPPQGSGCGRAVPSRARQHQRQAAHQGSRVLHARLDAARGAELGVLPGDRLHRRPAVLPGAARAGPGAQACEAWVMGNAEDTGKPGPTWMQGVGDALHDLRGERLRAQPRQSVLALHPDRAGGTRRAGATARAMTTSAARWKSTADVLRLPALQSWAGAVRVGMTGAGVAAAGRSEL